MSATLGGMRILAADRKANLQLPAARVTPGWPVSSSALRNAFTILPMANMLGASGSFLRDGFAATAFVYSSFHPAGNSLGCSPRHTVSGEPRNQTASCVIWG